MRAFVQQPAAHVYKQFPVFCKVARVVHRRLHEYIFYKESGKACFAAFLKIALNDQIAATSVFFHIFAFVVSDKCSRSTSGCSLCSSLSATVRWTWCPYNFFAILSPSLTDTVL